MKKILCLLLLMVSCAFSFSAGGLWQLIKGSYVFSHEPISDPLPNGQEVAYLEIKGNLAKEIFLKISNAKTKKNACGEQGLNMKSLGGLVCTKSGDEFSCNFGVGMQDGMIHQGFTC